MIMQRYAITVTGKVQGVFFRDTARRVATELGLVGFARNEPDGSVYIEVEGEESALKQFLAWCHTGPSAAKIENLTHSIKEPTAHTGFTIQ
jgi:acylphosphatase